MTQLSICRDDPFRFNHLIAPHEFGALVWVPTFDEDGDGMGVLLAFLEDTDELPEDLIVPMWHASKLGCRYIELDRDADTIDGLPVFDW